MSRGTLTSEQLGPPLGAQRPFARFYYVITDNNLWPCLTPHRSKHYCYYMNVSLTHELERFIESKVKSGLYHSQSEVVRDGLRLLIEQDQLLQSRREELDAKIKRGLDQLARGEFVTGEQATEHFRQLSDERRRKRA